MKILKWILAALVMVWVVYVLFIYATGMKKTYLIPVGYTGSLVILANQSEGVKIDPKDIIYDFTKNKIIKIKGDLIDGFFPLGYINYYSVDGKLNRHKIKVVDGEVKDIKDNKIYVWDYYGQIGGCEVKKHKISFEIIVIGDANSMKKILDQRQEIVNGLCM